jgi:hypothetical protein
MTKAAVAAKVHKSFDAHLNPTAQITFHLKILIEEPADLDDLCLSQLIRACRWINVELSTDCTTGCPADSVDVCQGNIEPLTTRQIDTCNACHGSLLTLPLLVPRVDLADHSEDATAANHPAVLTDRLYRRSHFHR